MVFDQLEVRPPRVVCLEGVLHILHDPPRAITLAVGPAAPALAAPHLTALDDQGRVLRHEAVDLVVEVVGREVGP